MDRALPFTGELTAEDQTDPLGVFLARAPYDDEPSTPEEDAGARSAREEIELGEVHSAEQIKREIG